MRTSNDADCFAVSEATDGAGRGHRVVFGVILGTGTGTGAGIAVDGRAHHGPNHSGGEWGHNPLPRPDVTEIPEPALPVGQPDRGRAPAVYEALSVVLHGPAA